MAEARLAIGDYGVRPIGEAEIERLLDVFNLGCVSAPITVPAILFPPVSGRFWLVTSAGLPRSVRRYVHLHELAHVLAGEANELTELRFTGPLPESEDVCDLFALLGIVPTADIEEGGDWLETRIRQLVPLDDRGWQVHRIPRLARRLPRVREMVGDLHGYF